MRLRDGSVRAGGETPVASVPGERIAVRGGLYALEIARNDIDQQLLIERDARQRFGPEPLQRGVERALVGSRRRGGRRVQPTVARSRESRRPASMRAWEPVATWSVTVMRSAPRSRMPRRPARKPAAASSAR